MALQHDVVFGGVKPCLELPSIGGIGRLCVWPPGGHTSGSRQQVLLGGRIFSHSLTLQSRRAGGAYSQNLSLAGLALPHDLFGLLGGVEAAAGILDPLDHESGTWKRVTVGGNGMFPGARTI